MMKKIKVVIFLMSLVSSLQPIVCDEIYEYCKPVITYLRHNEFMSPDLKSACEEYPEFFYQIAREMVGLLYTASQRPDNSTVDQALERLRSGTIELADIVTVSDCYFCYGEPTLINDNLTCLGSEPTSQPVKNGYLNLSFFKEEKFECSLCTINDIIWQLGKRLSWEDKEIKEERDYFKKRLIVLLYENLQDDIILFPALHTYQMQKQQELLKKLTHELTKEKNDTEKTALEVTDLQNQCDTIHTKLKKISEIKK